MAESSDVLSGGKSSVSPEVVKKDAITAKDFLVLHGFQDLIHTLVDQHKFQEKNDLRLLTSNADVMKTLDLPFCRVLKLKETLDSLDKEDKTKLVPVKETVKEIAKSRLLELTKTHLSAQAANHAWNKFNTIICSKVKSFTSEGKWEGTGGLKSCPGTTDQQSKVNLELCNEIAEDQGLKALFGVYQIDGEGVITLDKVRAKRHISNIMCSLRKPSAYQKRAPKQPSQRKKRALKATKNGENVQESASKRAKMLSKTAEELVISDQDAEADKNMATPVEDTVQNLATKGSAIQPTCSENNTGIDKDISEYESERLKHIKENELQLLKTGFVPRHQAIQVGLFFLKSPKISTCKMNALKDACKKYSVPFAKTTNKEDLLRSLGKVVFEKKIVQRKDQNEIISYKNLVNAHAT